MEKILIIGGVAGGMSAAARLRRLSEKAEIIVFEKGEYISFANCGLPYYIGGMIRERDSLLLQTPEAFGQRFKVDVRIHSTVTAIDRSRKMIRVRDLTKQTEYEESYDKLILAPGADPVKPPLPGIDAPNIFTLRNIPDTDRIYDFIAQNHPADAVVIGGGAIGLEMAENLVRKGLRITIVEALPQVLGLIDFEMAAIVAAHLQEKGVELIVNDKVLAFTQSGRSTHIKLAGGRQLESGLVLLSIGVRPAAELAKACGLALGERGGIQVNEYLQTSDPAVYAVGDAVEAFNPLLGTWGPVPLAGPANKQGRMAADNIVTGNTVAYRGTIGTGVLKAFELTVAFTGAGDKLLSSHRIPYLSTIVHPEHHAGYFPGAEGLSLKLLFSPGDGKILGAQIVGRAGVEKRIDVIAAFIQMGGTVHDLAAFEHCYAPPFSSAKDPVNIAGFTAQNILTGRIRTVAWNDLMNAEGAPLLLDVRTKAEFDGGTLPGSLNIPLNTLRKKLKELDKGRKIIIFCEEGFRAYIGARILMQEGFTEVYNLSGGYKICRNVL